MGTIAQHARATSTGVALVVVTVVALLLAGLPGDAHADPDPGTDPDTATGRVGETGSRASRASGFAVDVAPGWIGAYRVQGRLVYRLTPRKKATGSYGPARRVSSSSRAAARAAYLLSRYGARGDAYQSAAVDAALLHLMSGGRYAFDQGAGAKRIERIGRYHRDVTVAARRLLTDSGERAGPYVTTLTSTAGTHADDRTTLTFTVRSPGGRGPAGLPVVFTYANARYQSVTDADGVAVKAGVPVAAGSNPARASAGRVPDWQLAVRKAVERRGRSAVAVAGLTRVVAAETVVTGMTDQTVTIGNNPTGPVLAGQRIGGTFSVSGGSGTRSARVAVHFGLDQPDDCTSAPRATWSTTVTSDSPGGALNPFATARTGFYSYGVVVRGNDSSTPATRCGAGVRVERQALLNQIGATTRRKGQGARVEVVVRGFDRAEARTMRSELHGPYATRPTRCPGPGVRPHHTRTWAVGHNANVVVTAPVRDANRFYIWKTILPGGPFIRGAVHCGAAFKVVP